MGTLAPIPREVVEFAGVRTYFFPNLALYADFNSDLIEKHPEEANPVVTYILGATEKRPTQQEIKDIIIPDYSDPTAVNTGMDASLALGGEFTSFYLSLIPRLNALNHSHDLSSHMNNKRMDSKEKKKRDLDVLHRTTRLRKGIPSKILSILCKILSCGDDFEAKFESILELSAMDLDFDAYVLMKILELEKTDEMREHGQIIKENVMEMMRTKKPGLCEIMKRGPDELTYLLTKASIDESALKLINHYTKQWKSDDTDDVTTADGMEKRRLLIHQLLFLITRTALSPINNVHVAKQMIAWIPMEIRREMFPRLQLNRIEKTLEYASSVVQRFLKSNDSTIPSFNSWELVGIEWELIENPWSRRAIISILDTLRFTINQPFFGNQNRQFVPLDPRNPSNHDDVMKKCSNGLRFASWILENYENNYEDSRHLQYLNGSKEHVESLVEEIREAMEEEDSEDTSSSSSTESSSESEEDEYDSEEEETGRTLRKVARMLIPLEEAQKEEEDALDAELEKALLKDTVDQERITVEPEGITVAEAAVIGVEPKVCEKKTEVLNIKRFNGKTYESFGSKLFDGTIRTRKEADDWYSREPSNNKELLASLQKPTMQQRLKALGWKCEEAPPKPSTAPTFIPQSIFTYCTVSISHTTVSKDKKKSTVIKATTTVSDKEILGFGGPNGIDLGPNGPESARKFGRSEVDSEKRRRLFGGVGLGEKPKFSGFV